MREYILDLCATIVTEKEFVDLTPEEIAQAFEDRIKSLDDNPQDWFEAVGFVDEEEV